MKTEKIDIKPANFICMTSWLNAESQTDTVSITHVVERLDIEAMLNRAQQGILDLSSYQRPMVADVVGTHDSAEVAIATIDLLNEPDTPMNYTFGTDRETASKTLANLQSLANSNRVEKVEELTKDEPTTTPKEEGKDE